MKYFIDVRPITEKGRSIKIQETLLRFYTKDITPAELQTIRDAIEKTMKDHKLKSW